MSTHSEPHREGQGSPEFPTPQDPGNPSTETDPEDLGSQMDSVSEKRIRSHTDKGAVYYEGIVNSHTSKLVQTRCDIDAVVDSVARKAKTESELLAHKEQLSELCNQYKEQSREFIEFLHHAHTAQSKQEVVSQELILSNVVAKVNSMFEQIHYMIKHSQEETKSIPASHTSGESKSSSVSSILLRQRAKVEATKAALDFAKQEAELKRKEALIEEQAMKAKAEEIRRKSEVQLDIDILNRTRDAVVADAELSAMRDELDELHLDNIGSVVDNTERTTQYVLKHTKVEPIVPEHSVPLMLNPHAMPFVSQDPPVVSSATPNIPNPVNQAKSNVVESSSANTPNQHNSNVAEPISANANLNVAGELTRLFMKKELLTSRFTDFNDCPEAFPVWKASFTNIAREFGVNAREELDLLVLHLGPESSKYATSLRIANAQDPPRALRLVWERLEEKFGRPEMVESALKRKLENFPRLTVRDYKKLYDLSDLLSEIESVKANPSYSTLLAYFDASSGVNQVVCKLPYSVQTKWKDRAIKYKKAHGVTFPPFVFFVQFIREMSTYYNDPAFILPDEPKPKAKSSGTVATVRVSTKKTEVQHEEKLSLCPVHKLKHSLNDCKAFRKKSLNDRKQILRDNHICYKCCESRAHIYRDCKASVKCAECGSLRHPTAMHVDKPSSLQQPNASSVSGKLSVSDSHSDHGGERLSEAASVKCTKVCGEDFKGRSCSKTILVKVYPTGEPQNCMKLYAVIDDQSNRTLGRSEFFDRMNVSDTEIQHYTLSSCSGRVPMSGRRASGFTIEAIDGSAKMELPTIIECNEIPDQREEIPTPEVTYYHEHLKEVEIPPLDPSSNILLLIGRDLIEVHHVVEQVTGPKDAPFAQKLSLGWVIIGDVCLGKTHKPSNVVHVNKTCVLKDGRPTNFQQCQNNFTLEECETYMDKSIGRSVFERTKKDENIGYSVDDQKFIQMMDREFAKNEEGNWIAPLPFKTPRPQLPNNRSMALKRAHILKASLEKDPVKKEHFVSFMERIMENGHAEVAPPLEQSAECWYLPLFGVYHPKKKDQIRVVFDSSAKYNDISLNNVLMSGPDLANSLVGVLLRFRSEPVAIMADIQQMFYGFYVTEKHRNYLRFFWFRDNDPNKELVEYRMCVHVFGNCPSPAVATYGLRKCVQDIANSGVDVKVFVENNFYVDDGLASFPTASEAVDVLKRTQHVLASQGNLRLHKIASNSDTVLGSFPIDDLAKEFGNLDLGKDELPLQRSLGLCWNLHTDSFTYTISDDSKPITRRGVLSTVNSLFDPLGFIAPVVLQGRVLMRDLLSETSDWDAPLSEKSQRIWCDWKMSLKLLENVQIPRCFVPTSLQSCKDVTLHIFSDASEKAIAAVAYLRTVDANGKVNVGFVFGKTKIAPKHGHTIPRLELCAAVLAVEIAEFVSDQLNISSENMKFYTDSKVVLGYLYNQVRRFHIYVSNRASKIRKFTEPEQWCYVATDVNPADCGTRHVTADQLQNCAWLYGPSFLRNELENETRDETFHLVNPEDDKELRQEVDVSKTNVMSSGHLGTKRFQRFSKWRNLVMTISRLQHIVRCFSEKRESCSGWHSCSRYKDVDAYSSAELFIIREVQYECYAKEIECLKKGKPLPRNSSVLSLSPYLDSDNILRVGGRLKGAQIPLHEKSPILIPGAHHIATLLIRHYHESVCHQGRHFTEGAVRSAGYWITGGKRLISSLLFKCVMCRKLRGRLGLQKMADLPQDRMTPSPPFTYVGVDVFGPWSVVTRRTRGGSANSKRWAVLFTCLACRAVHIELIEEMSSSSFINALRRFYAIRGKVKEFRSDCGTNFVGATDDLCIDAINVKSEPVGKLLYDSGTVWKFNPPHSSHMGGVWERLIGVTRRILDAMFAEAKSKHLTHEVLSTFMAEVCAIINHRPIVPVSSDAESPQVLTPSVLLTQKTDAATDSFEHLSEKEMYRSQWKYVQVLAENFWSRWRREYLPTLQQRQKWNQETPNVKEGDVVLLKDKDVIRNDWPMGIILRAFPSSDNLVRKVEVRVLRNGNTAVFIRPITEIVKLL